MRQKYINVENSALITRVLLISFAVAVMATHWVYGRNVVKIKTNCTYYLFISLIFHQSDQIGFITSQLSLIKAL